MAEPNWDPILEFLEQTRIDGFVADPRHIVEEYRQPVASEIERLGLDLSNEQVAFAFVSGLIEQTRLNRGLWLEGVRSKEFYKSAIQDLFTCLVCIKQYLPVAPFAKYFDPLLS